MKLKNNTDSAQYIGTIDGGSYVAMPGEIIEINEKIIYKEEFERALPFFESVNVLPGSKIKEEFKKPSSHTKKEIKSEDNNG